MKSKKIVLLTIIFSFIFSTQVTAADYLFHTEGYGYASCPEPASSCNDYYSNHFEATFIASGQPGQSQWFVDSAQSRLNPTYINQNGDQWTTENFRVYGSGANIAHENNTYRNNRNTGYTWQTFNPDVNVPQKNNMVWFYYYYQLKYPNGSNAELWHPMRNRVNF
ncbi:hypothetical protein MHI43_01510 [Paenibacillus sp. FSL H8-0457]|uniref:hypothetical protein n=1 Tax=unclassified Paenibacillus TaxID=185978 RepID=UPI0005649640|nr:hypothetical protein [Paenibacillus sp. FSL H8-457]